MTGTDEEQGRMYGIFEALNGLASLLLSFIMIGVMAVVGGSDLITGFKSALAFMGGLSIVYELGRKAEEDHLQGLCVRL